MGRFLQSGEFKPKPSTAKKSERMYGSIEFQTALRKGTNVKVFIGAGWEKGTITDWQKNRVSVRLSRGNRTVTCYDARNLEVLS